jgi:hypothetical protein
LGVLGSPQACDFGALVPAPAVHGVYVHIITHPFHLASSLPRSTAAHNYLIDFLFLCILTRTLMAIAWQGQGATHQFSRECNTVRFREKPFWLCKTNPFFLAIVFLCFPRLTVGLLDFLSRLPARGI